MLRPEVIVLGGGPAGSTTAASLALRGRHVLLLEREKFPRFHIGESLLPRSREVFQKLGLEASLDERFLKKYGARFLCATTRRTSSYRFTEAFDAPFDYAYQVRRDVFDELLLRRAAALGAEVREQWRAVSVLFEGDKAVGVRACPVGAGGSDEVEIRAPIVVDATGRDTLLASRTRRKAPVARLDKTALFSHFAGAVRQEGDAGGDIQIAIFEGGWFWFIPFRDGETSVGAVVGPEWMKRRASGESLDALFDRIVASCSWAAELLEGATRLRPVQALADFSYRVDQLAGNGWLTVGDSSGFLDPLFSTGAHLAIKGADLAASAIDAALSRGDCSRAAFLEYEGEVRYAVDLFLGVVQGFYEGNFRETLFEPNQRPTLRRLITSMLSGDVFHGASQPTWAKFLRGRYPAEVPVFE